METIRFKRDKQEFVKELRASVKEYFENQKLDRHGNAAILIKTFVMGVVYLVPFSLLLSGTISSVGIVLLCWVVMGLGVSGIGLGTMHDANHGAFSKHKWVNKLFSNSLYLLGGFPANWRFQHNTLHHGYTNVEGQDEDIGHGGILRFSPHKPLKKIHRFQFVYAWFLYGLMTFSWVVIKDFTKLKKYKDMGAVLNSSGSYKKLYWSLLVSKVVYFGVFIILPIWLVPVAWYWSLLGFMIMHLTSGFVLSIIFQTAHVVPSSEYPLPDEKHELEYNWSVHQLHTTCDFAPRSKVLSWLIGGLNFQVVHHLFPNISHVHYKNLAILVEQTAHKYGLPYHVNRTFRGAIWQHLLMLKQLGR